MSRVPSPRVGDKVIYIVGQPGTRWHRRAGVVVDLPDNAFTLLCAVYSPGSDGRYGALWYASPTTLRVIERATYTPVDAGAP